MNALIAKYSLAVRWAAHTESRRQWQWKPHIRWPKYFCHFSQFFFFSFISCKSIPFNSFVVFPTLHCPLRAFCRSFNCLRSSMKHECVFCIYTRRLDVHDDICHHCAAQFIFVYQRWTLIDGFCS